MSTLATGYISHEAIIAACTSLPTEPCLPAAPIIIPYSSTADIERAAVKAQGTAAAQAHGVGQVVRDVLEMLARLARVGPDPHGPDPLGPDPFRHEGVTLTFRGAHVVHLRNLLPVERRRTLFVDLGALVRRPEQPERPKLLFKPHDMWSAETVVAACTTTRVTEPLAPGPRVIPYSCSADLTVAAVEARGTALVHKHHMGSEVQMVLQVLARNGSADPMLHDGVTLTFYDTPLVHLKNTQPVVHGRTLFVDLGAMWREYRRSADRRYAVWALDRPLGRLGRPIGPVARLALVALAAAGLFMWARL
jgi:hypothetical protein